MFPEKFHSLVIGRIVLRYRDVSHSSRYSYKKGPLTKEDDRGSRVIKKRGRELLTVMDLVDNAVLKTILKRLVGKGIQGTSGNANS